MNNLVEELNNIIDKYNNCNEIDKNKYLYDYNQIVQIINLLYDYDYEEIDSSKLNSEVNREDSIINKEIYDNLDLLESLYSTILNNISLDNVDDIECNLYGGIDKNLFNDFFSRIHNMKNIFNRTIDNNQIIIDEIPNGVTLNLKSINKQYLLFPNEISLNTIAHEFGHLYDISLVNNNGVTDNSFLKEFISMLFELLFIDYYKNIDYRESKALKNIFISNYCLLINSLLSQIRLMKKYKDVYLNMDLNPKYNDEINDINIFNYNNQLKDLSIQYYGIGLLLITYFYPLIKDNYNFELINDYVIKNKNNFNLKDILNLINNDIVKSFVTDYLNTNNKIK